MDASAADAAIAALDSKDFGGPDLHANEARERQGGRENRGGGGERRGGRNRY